MQFLVCIQSPGIQVTKGIAAMLVYTTKKFNYNSIVIAHQHGGYDFTCKPRIMNDKGHDSQENVITGGDFNCTLNPNPRHSIVNAIGEIQTDIKLHDIWRTKLC